MNGPISADKLLAMKFERKYPDLWANRDMNTPFVYFMLAHDVDQYSLGVQNAKFVKIGVAADPIKREVVVQTGCPFEVNLWTCVKGGYPLEKKIHKFLKMHRVAGEWFRPHDLVLDVMRDSPEDLPEISW